MTPSIAEWPPIRRPLPDGPLLDPDGLADRALTRTSGAPLVPGNAVRVLRDAGENYPAWLAAIAGARHSIRFEQYIVRDDSVGRRFAEALMERAAAGVEVRVLYDWFGCLGTAGTPFWRRLAAAGVRVEAMSPPRLEHPFAWVRRDHRKTIVVDDRIAFVSGLCISELWEGGAGAEPWRDTGIALEGPAVADVSRAFDQLWAVRTGDRRPDAAVPPVAGDVPVRVVASAPRGTGLFRLDQLIAAAAADRLWLSDAYFVGTAPYVQALRAAARDGVDVRLLVPGAGDIGWLRPLSRAGYRVLLEAGVRVFEWSGSMLHAKTAVADSRWCRVGSTNLNLASFLGNWELDIAIEHAGTAAVMEAQFEADLARSTEIVLRRCPRSRLRVENAATAYVPTGSGVEPDAMSEVSSSQVTEMNGSNPHDEQARNSFSNRRLRRRSKASGRKAAAGALRLGNAVGAALFDRRTLGPAEARVDLAVAVIALVVATVAVLWPRVLTWPLAVLGGWVGLAMLWRAARAVRARPEP